MNWIKLFIGFISLVIGIIWLSKLFNPSQNSKMQADWFLPKYNYIRNVSSSIGLIIIGIGLILQAVNE